MRLKIWLGEPVRFPCAYKHVRETAVAWIRLRLTQTTPEQCWVETRTEYEARLKEVVADINANLDVQGLCYKLPHRLEKMLASEGGRLSE